MQRFGGTSTSTRAFTRTQARVATPEWVGWSFVGAAGAGAAVSRRANRAFVQCAVPPRLCLCGVRTVVLRALSVEF